MVLRMRRCRRGIGLLLASAAALAIAAIRAGPVGFVPGPERGVILGDILEGDIIARQSETTSAGFLGASLGAFGGAGLVMAADAQSSGGDWFQPFVDLNANLIEGIDGFVGSAGVAVIIYTFLIRGILFPLSQPGIRSSAVMQLIQPQVEEVEKFAGADEEKKNKLLRNLYKEVGINPLTVLLPVFLQIPIFLGLFRAIGQLARQSDHFKEPFLWIPSLAGPVVSGNPSLNWLVRSQSADHFEPLVGWHDALEYLVLPVMVVLSMVISQGLISVKKGLGPAEILFPVFIGISTLVSPQGLGVYWLVNTWLTTLQTLVVKQMVSTEFPNLKAKRETYDEEEGKNAGLRYTRESPFKGQELIAASETVAALKDPEFIKPETRSARRSQKKGK